MLGDVILSIVMLSVVMLRVFYAERCYAERCYDESRGSIMYLISKTLHQFVRVNSTLKCPLPAERMKHLGGV